MDVIPLLPARKEDQRPGEASVCQVDPLSGNPGRSVARIYSVPEQVGWKGVCEPDNIGALTVDVTHKATVGKREGGGACIFFCFVFLFGGFWSTLELCERACLCVCVYMRTCACY